MKSGLRQPLFATQLLSHVLRLSGGKVHEIDTGDKKNKNSNDHKQVYIFNATTINIAIFK